ncbi:MAG TPA: response regulator [Candidatus Saccharibacteria bacterium]|nr:response regulator [Candidatus Saccharibacteria bacterium]
MKKQEVLIIEDDEWLSEQYSRILKLSGYNVKTSSNALLAIDIIDKKIPDIIILDILLTGNTAFALLHELQSYTDTANIPIIICSNLSSNLNIDELKKYGIQLILDKTKMKPDDLTSAIRSLIN